MSIRIRRGLLLVALIVVVGALLLNVGVSSPTDAQSLETQQSSATPEVGTAETTTTQTAAARENGLIAFESNQSTQNLERDQEIFAMNPDGTGLTNLTNNSVPDVDPAWSADGRQIAFMCQRNGGATEVCKMDANGSNQVQLTNDPGQSFWNPTWSPDGTKIAFSNFDCSGNIYVMNADGTGQRQLASRGCLPDWSPDGNQIVFASFRDNDNEEIYKMNADGSGQTRLTNDTRQDGHDTSRNDTAPAWSPDGNQIVFQSKGEPTETGNVYEIYKMNADGSGETRLTANPTAPSFNGIFDFAPDWSPDGKQIVFQSNRTMNSGLFRNDEIYVMNADGSDQRNLTNTVIFEMDRDPDWQPLDTTPPVLSLPADITEEATGSDGAQVTYDVSAEDTVDGSVNVSCTPDSGSKFSLGDTTVNCSAQDAAGNEVTGSFIVTVEDTTAPSLTVPRDTIVVEATDASGTTVNFADDVSASDAVDPNPSIECTPASGSTFELGTTTVSCTAKDASGNESSAKTFEVRVTDGVVSPCDIGEIEPPVNNVSSADDPGMSAYKYGSRGIIPAKFRALCNGDPIDTQAEADAHPMKLTLAKVGATPDQDAVVENTVTGLANTGDLFRFDDSADHYIYNVGVKNLAKGTYKITISEANGGATHDEWFSIK
jgi:Tol biopolymer transport system component